MSAGQIESQDTQPEVGERVEIRYKLFYTRYFYANPVIMAVIYLCVFVWPTVSAVLAGEVSTGNFLLAITLEMLFLLFFLAATCFTVKQTKKQYPMAIDETGIHYPPSIFRRVAFVPWEGTSVLRFPIIAANMVTHAKTGTPLFFHLLIPRLKMIQNRDELTPMLEKYDTKELFW